MTIEAGQNSDQKRAMSHVVAMDRKKEKPSSIWFYKNQDHEWNNFSRDATTLLHRGYSLWLKSPQLKLFTFVTPGAVQYTIDFQKWSKSGRNVLCPPPAQSNA